MIDLPLSECTTWYNLLQGHPGLDQRDTRGKRHDLALVLVELLMSMLRGRDGSLSSLHRSMVWLHDRVCEVLYLSTCKVISRSQLPLVLEKVNGELLEELLSQHWPTELSSTQRRWFAADGKTLRGSIPKGATQGQNVVQLVSHSQREVVAEAFYEGEKESEIPTLRNLLKAGPYLAEGISVDALHGNPTTLGLMAEAGGVFVVGLKDNQPELLQEMRRASHILPPCTITEHTEKGHGRLETRTYHAYDIREQYLEQRWESVGFQSLITVRRQRTQLKSQHKSEETAFFMTNAPKDETSDVFEAIRNHWQVEVSNHIRDVTLKEDQLRSKFPKLNRIMARVRTMAIKILQPTPAKNCKAIIEQYQDQIDKLILDLRAMRVL